MKKYVVIQSNELLVTVSHQFDTLEDANQYRDLMSRNCGTFSNGKPKWEYTVYVKQ